MRPICLFLAATVLLGLQPAFGAAKDTYAHKMEMGQLLFFNGDIDRAIAAFKRAAELNPKAFEPHLNLVNLYFQKGGDEALASAKAECQEVLKLKPTHKDARLLHATLLKNEAGTLGADKEKVNAKIDEAVKEFEAAQDAGAAVPLCETNISVLLLQKGDFPKALEHINAALDKQPVLADAHLIKGLLMFKTAGLEVDKLKEPEAVAKVQPVLDEFDLAIKQKEKNFEAMKQKADILMAMGKKDEALKLYEQAVAAEPRYFDGWMMIGNVRADMMANDKEKANEHLDKAREAFDKARTLRPDDKNAAYSMGVILEKAGKLEDALHEFQKGVVTETDPQTKAQILMHIQQLQQATGHYTGGGFGGIGGISIPAPGGVGGNIFTQGLQQPFANLIQLDKDKK